MSRAVLVRRVALGAMILVTSWSLWSWAQPMNQATPHAGTIGPPPTTMHGGAAQSPVGAAPAEPEDETPGPINWTEFGGRTPPFIATLINFAILAAAYYALGRKPIGKALQNRRDAISKEIDEAQSMKREAEARAKSYQAKLEKLEDEMRAARETLLQAGEAERERIVKDADAKAERMRKDAEFMVQQEIKQIRVDLWREAVEAAVVAAEALLKERVTPSDQERVAEDYLAGLARQQAAPVAASAAAPHDGAS